MRLTKVVVADTGPLIAIAYLDLFSLFPNVLGSVLVPKLVMDEIQVEPVHPDVICINKAVEKRWLSIEHDLKTVDNDFPLSLGLGEQAAINLAKERQCPVLIDDKLARQFATSQELKVIGTAGVLIKAKQMGLIDEVVPLLSALGSKGYYFSSTLIDRIKVIAGEE